MISKKEVQRIGELARLNLTEKEIEKFQKEFSLILNYIEKLKKVNVSDVQPTSHPFEIKNITRKDEPDTNKNKAMKKDLLSLAPETREGYLKVKKILQ